MSEEKTQPCTESCPHEQWINRWIEREEREIKKEQRRAELMSTVKTNVISWLVIGCIGYTLIILWDGMTANVKDLMTTK